MSVLTTIGLYLWELIKILARLVGFALKLIIWLAASILRLALVVFTIGIIRM